MSRRGPEPLPQPTYSPLRPEGRPGGGLSWSSSGSDSDSSSGTEAEVEKEVKELDPFVPSLETLDGRLPLLFRSTSHRHFSQQQPAIVHIKYALQSAFMLFFPASTWHSQRPWMSTSSSGGPARFHCSQGIHCFLELTLVAFLAAVWWDVGSDWEEEADTNTVVVAHRTLTLWMWLSATHLLLARPAAACLHMLLLAAGALARGGASAGETRQKTGFRVSGAEAGAGVVGGDMRFDASAAYQRLQQALLLQQSSLAATVARNDTSDIWFHDVWKEVLHDASRSERTVAFPPSTASSAVPTSSPYSLSAGEVECMLAFCWLRTNEEAAAISTASPSPAAMNERLFVLFFLDLLPLDVSCLLEYVDQSFAHSWQSQHQQLGWALWRFFNLSLVADLALIAAYLATCVYTSLFLARCWQTCDDRGVALLPQWVATVMGYVFALRLCVVDPLMTLLVQVLLPWWWGALNHVFLVRNTCLSVTLGLLRKKDRGGEVGKETAGSCINAFATASTHLFVSKGLAERFPCCAMSECLKRYEPACSLLYPHLRLLLLEEEGKATAGLIRWRGKGKSRVAPLPEGLSCNIGNDDCYYDDIMREHVTGDNNVSGCDGGGGEVRPAVKSVGDDVEEGAAKRIEETRTLDERPQWRGGVEGRVSDLRRKLTWGLRTVLLCDSPLLKSKGKGHPLQAGNQCPLYAADVRAEDSRRRKLLLFYWVDTLLLLLLSVGTIGAAQVLLVALPEVTTPVVLVASMCALVGSLLLLACGFCYLSRCAIARAFYSVHDCVSTNVSWSMQSKCVVRSRKVGVGFPSGKTEINMEENKKNNNNGKDDDINVDGGSIDDEEQEQEQKQVDTRHPVPVLIPDIATPQHQLLGGAKEETAGNNTSLVESYVKALTVRETFDQDKLEHYKEQLLQRVVAKIQLKQRLHNEALKKEKAGGCEGGGDDAVSLSLSSTLNDSGGGSMERSDTAGGANPSCKRYRPVVSSSEAMNILKQTLDKDKRQARALDSSSCVHVAVNTTAITVASAGSPRTSGADTDCGLSTPHQQEQRGEGKGLSEKKLADIRKRVVHLTHGQAAASHSEALQVKRIMAQQRLDARLSGRRGAGERAMCLEDIGGGDDNAEGSSQSTMTSASSSGRSNSSST